MLITRLLRWLLFTVAIALMPFAFAWVRSIQYGGSIGLADVAGGGDLYLVATAIAATGIGELAGTGRHRRPRTLLLAHGFAVLVLLWAALFYADAAAARTSATGTDTRPRPTPLPSQSCQRGWY